MGPALPALGFAPSTTCTTPARSCIAGAIGGPLRARPHGQSEPFLVIAPVAVLARLRHDYRVAVCAPDGRRSQHVARTIVVDYSVSVLLDASASTAADLPLNSLTRSAPTKTRKFLVSPKQCSLQSSASRITYAAPTRKTEKLRFT